MVRSLTLIRIAILGGCLAVAAHGVAPAWASLGGDAASIAADQVHLRGTRQIVPGQSYSVHEIRTESGIVVREFVSTEGHVFAVAWHGPWPADLRQVLGSYFDQYTQAVQQQSSPGHRFIKVEQPELVVHMGGHPHAFVGRAFIPSMVPSGVRVEDLQ